MFIRIFIGNPYGKFEYIIDGGSKMKELKKCMYLLVFVLCASFTDASASQVINRVNAETSINNEDWGYIESEDGSLTIIQYRGSDTDIIIPGSIDGKKVTKIGENAFYERMSLTSVVIPTSVTNIGEHAFYGCRNLISVTIPEGVTNIGENAFCGCWNLISVTIPEGVTSIGAFAFDGCESLTSITLPSSVTSIDSFAFRVCSGLNQCH